MDPLSRYGWIATLLFSKELNDERSVATEV